MIGSLGAKLRSKFKPDKSAPNTAGQMRFLDRSNYKETWNRLVSDRRRAFDLVVGQDSDEELLLETGNQTIEILERAVGIKPDDVILEIGCGVGRVGKLLSQRCAQWIGTDISRQMLAVAGERLEGCENVELIELEKVGLDPISDNSVDLVYCTVVFMHLFEWDRYQYILEAMRVLKPGGRCYFDNADITSDGGWRMFMESFSFPPQRRPAHISMISTGDELQTYAEKAGFDNVRLHRWNDTFVAVTGVKPHSPP